MTSSPLTSPWDNSRVVHGPVAHAVHELKSMPGGDIGVHGSITLVKSLLAERLVDVLHLAVGPVLDPVGRRVFEGLDSPRALELVAAVPTSGGAVWLTYRFEPAAHRARRSSSPG